MSSKTLLLGNEAIALGLWEAGCRLAAAYPGTPSSEVLESLAERKADDLHLEWSVNEKVAVEVASAAALSGLRSAAVMKQVGLNVAMDPLMSLAYTGVAGGMLLVVADDPGPYSSQTEQDTRMAALFAGVPVLDPATPEEAREMVHLGFALSEKYQIPVILRPVLRVCHSRGPVSPARERVATPPPRFVKEPSRWAATPRFRYQLHIERDRKLAELARDPLAAETLRWLVRPVPVEGVVGSRRKAPLAILASGAASAYAADLLREVGVEVPLLAVGVPFPLDAAAVADRLAGFRQVLVLEETEPLLERLLAGRLPLAGRLDGSVPSAGEMTPDTVAEAVARHLPQSQKRFFAPSPRRPVAPSAPEAPPTLCAGCPHRASFWALRKALPRAIYTGDIGCYTLGISLGAVDTVLCMGASISQASGFFWAHRGLGEQAPPVAAAIGDSTFFHAGAQPLLNAVQQGAAFTLLILDNGTTAMTGGQPTPGTGERADGSRGEPLDLEALVRGCGVTELAVADPLDVPATVEAIRRAGAAAREGKVAVVICRSPCVLSLRERAGAVPGVSPGACNRCRLCVERFACPALRWTEAGAVIVPESCNGCGACIAVCPQNAIGRAP